MADWIINAMALLIQSARIVTMDPQRRVLEGSLLIEGSRIAAVGDIETKDDPTELPLRGEAAGGPASGRPDRGNPSAVGARTVEVYDAGGSLLLPGFVQTHVHLCQALLRNQANDLSLLDWLSRRIWPYEAAHDARSMEASARLGIAELLAGGTTCIQDMGSLRHTEVILETARRLGLRGVFGKALMDDAGTCPPGLVEPTAQALAEAGRLADTWQGKGGGRLRYAYAPRFALSCTDGLLREAAQEARRRGCRLHTHASENRDEIAWVRRRTGLDNIEYLQRVGLTGPDVGLAHCIHLSEREQAILQATGTRVLHCPSANAMLASGVALVPELRARGVTVSLGADGAPCNNNLDIFQEMRLCAQLQKLRLGPTALPAADILAMATIDGARALGWDDEIGSIEVGKRADLVLLDLDRPHVQPLGDVYGSIVYAARAADVELVIVDGRVVAREGQILTDDPQEVTAAARRELAKLLERVK